MSDRTPAPDPLAALVAELREPVPVDPASRRRLMERVREMGTPVPAVGLPIPRGRGHARALATIRRIRGTEPRTGPRTVSASTLATAAGIALLLAVGKSQPAHMGSARGGPSVILGDTVVSTLRDTLRIVQFMLTAPAASRVALAGDFNGWNTRATPLAKATADGRWAVSLALAPGRHNYAYVVDDTQWVRDPAATPAEPNELTPPRSVIIIGR